MDEPPNSPCAILFHANEQTGLARRRLVVRIGPALQDLR
jgi:hypothetical protein